MKTTGELELLKENAAYLVNPPKGILAADESAKTCCKRFDDVHLECTDEARRAFREMIISAPELEDLITGIILTDETIRQSTKDGVMFTHVLMEKGIKPGIKVDEGITGFKNENDLEFITKGLEGLPARMPEYRNFGAVFAKWRAAYSVTHGLPTEDALAESVRRMREYAIICQQNGIVPIVEPEVLMDGMHSIEDMEETLRKVIGALMDDLKNSDVYMPGLILKTSMALSGKNADNRAKADEVAERTVALLKDLVPSDIGGVIFLSGGQSHEEANENYDAIMRLASEVPFPMTFSFSRAFQVKALAHYAKNVGDIPGAQKVLIDSIKNVAQL
jgi:fructose-bisphosphate aldolase class I